MSAFNIVFTGKPKNAFTWVLIDHKPGAVTFKSELFWLFIPSWSTMHRYLVNNLLNQPHLYLTPFNLVFLKTELRAKTENLWPFFIPDATKLTSMLFLDAYTGTYLLVFCFCVCIYYSNPRVESRRYLVNKNTSFMESRIGVLWHEEKKNNNKTKMSIYLQMFWGQIP